MMNALIVDDEEPARSELRFLLEETGRIDCIEEASNAREAVEALVRRKENVNRRRGIEVLFLDIAMPKTSGMQLAEALHQLKNPPAVVFVTAYSEYALRAFNVDAIDYLMKPVETDRLIHSTRWRRAASPSPTRSLPSSAFRSRRVGARCSFR